jgi:DNA polymerase-3 subunit alpha
LYCSDIVTFNTIADKGAIRDVGRALDIDLDTVGKICEAVDDEEKYREVRNKYKELFK